MKDLFALGDIVRVSKDFFWACGARGEITAPPSGLDGGSEPGIVRQEHSELGVNDVYWVKFDIPQWDAEGEGPFRFGFVWESALSLDSSA